MDEKQNENSPVVGDIYLSLKESLKDIYYKVTAVKGSDTGGTILHLEGLHKSDKMEWPVLFLDKIFVKVNKTTAEVLFGKKGEKNGATNDNQKG